MSENLAPVVLFVYGRLTETKSTIQNLQENFLAKDTELFIFSDGAKKEKDVLKVKGVRDYIHTVNGFKKVTIIEQDQNKGLAKSIIDGVTQIITQYEKVIVLEDDLLTSRNFLNYMNQALDHYKNDNRILSISGFSYKDCIPRDYPYDSSFGYRASSWGWGTWREKWTEVDWSVKNYADFRFNLFRRLRFNRGGSDMSHMLSKQMKGKINSWAIRFCYHQFENDMYDVFPKVSKITNIGFGAEGENCDFKNFEDEIDTSDKASFVFPTETKIDPVIVKNFKKHNSLYVRAKRVFTRIIKKDL
ncbi:sugar phosphate nucleotidyltransferase [Pleomorphovibrio marinus]|uniref:sugar phosphate nucleotidyltransferase n=1 Tax=Pleomorphovibrio marinus TaxID=2164132 RepID=UPI000E0C848D|nr:sugar phosphate nucleotidyltransferase [Pleomorphovibrio marinus]